MTFSLAGVSNAINQGLGIAGQVAQIVQTFRGGGAAPAAAAPAAAAPAAAAPAARAAVMPTSTPALNIAGNIGGREPIDDFFSDQAGSSSSGSMLSRATQLILQGGKYVQVPQRIASRFGNVAGGFDVITSDQVDDRELEKLASKGMIPAESDLGRALIAGGSKPVLRTIVFSDGTRAKMPVIVVARRRRRRNYNTPAMRRDAARTLRAVKRDLSHAKRLHRAARGLVPTTTRAAPSKRRRPSSHKPGCKCIVCRR